MFTFFKINFFLVQEVNKPSLHLVTVLEVKSYGFSDFTKSEGFSSLFRQFFIFFPFSIRYN